MYVYLYLQIDILHKQEVVTVVRKPTISVPYFVSCSYTYMYLYRDLLVHAHVVVW